MLICFPLKTAREPALHRRLLDCLAQMRLVLPPISRLVLNSSCQSNRLTQNYKLLADYEDKLVCLVSRQSMLKLVPLLTDPLLKLDEVSSRKLS